MTSVAPTLVMEKLQGTLNVPDSRVKRLGMPANPANLVAESLGSAHPTGLTWSSEGSISKHLKPRTNPAQTLQDCGEQRRRKHEGGPGDGGPPHVWVPTASVGDVSHVSGFLGHRHVVSTLKNRRSTAHHRVN